MNVYSGTYKCSKHCRKVTLMGSTDSATTIFYMITQLISSFRFFLVTVYKYLQVDANYKNYLTSIGKLSTLPRYFGISSSWLCVTWYFLFGYNTRNVYGWLTFLLFFLIFIFFTIFGESSLLQLLYIVSRKITKIVCTKYSSSVVRLSWN